jgi:ParB-like chromosome segregation protein Spo0J
VLKPISINIGEIYVPQDRRKELNMEKIDAIAEEILAEIDYSPIHVRKGNGRYVLVSGVNRLEANKALGEKNIQSIIVGAKLV